MNDKLKKYFKIFISMLYISAFTFGGGYVIISLMKSKFVDDLKWLDEDEMLNLAAIAQSSPGAVAVNASILVGYKVAGMSGAIVSILGTIIPPLVIISVISYFYVAFRSNLIVSSVLKGMQSGVAAVIFSVVMDLGGNIIKDKEHVSECVMVGAFIATYALKVNVIYVIVVCAAIGIFRAWRCLKTEKKEEDKKCCI